MNPRLARVALVVIGVVGLSSAPAHATPAPPDPVSTESSAPLIPVPVGCPVPTPADVAFVGTVLDKDGFIEKGTVRFQIDQVRSGDAGPFSVNGVLDVRYGPDSKYLEIEQQYLVGASVDPDIGVLASKVSPETPLFGGDAVVGLEDTEVECPVFDDPVQTLNLDGTPVDSGLLSPLFADRLLLLAVVGVPAAIAGAALVGLVLLRRLLAVGLTGVFVLGRQAVTPKPDHRASRVRTHRRDDPSDENSAADRTDDPSLVAAADRR